MESTTIDYGGALETARNSLKQLEAFQVDQNLSKMLAEDQAAIFNERRPDCHCSVSKFNELVRMSSSD